MSDDLSDTSIKFDKILEKYKRKRLIMGSSSFIEIPTDKLCDLCNAAVRSVNKEYQDRILLLSQREKAEVENSWYFKLFKMKEKDISYYKKRVRKSDSCYGKLYTKSRIEGLCMKLLETSNYVNKVSVSVKDFSELIYSLTDEERKRFMNVFNIRL